MFDFDVVMWLLGAVVAMLCAALVAIIVVVIGDNINPEARTGTGVVIEKQHSLPYTSFMMVGKVMVPQHHPETWRLCFQVEGVQDTDCVSVQQQYWNQTQEGTMFEIRYVLGNITRQLYIREIRPALS